jgi:hypothetical protein
MADVHVAERIVREAESTFYWLPYFLKQLENRADGDFHWI